MSNGKQRKKYSTARSNILIATRRAIRLEARMRCMLCEAYGDHWEFAHIDDNRNNHDPANIAYLCPNCHTLYDYGNQIDEKTLLVKKEQLRAENEEIQKLKTELAQYREATEIETSAAYAGVKKKYSRVFDEVADKSLFYQGLLFLLSGYIHLDEAGTSLREVIRDTLSISEAEEQYILEHLEKEKKIEVEDGLVVLIQKDDAKIAASEMIERGSITVESLVEAFSRYSI